MARRSTVAQPALVQGKGKRAGGRAGLLATSALSAAGLRGVAVAAGMVTVFGAAPALAQCLSGTVGNLLAAGCLPAATGGAASTTIGLGAITTGTFGTAVGNGANATGLEATAFGASSIANGDFATAVGVNANANGAQATATGNFSHANG